MSDYTLDPYEKHRDTMRTKYRYCGPYRLGIAVGEAGEDLPPPAHYTGKSAKNYRTGIETGRRLRAEREAEAS